MRVGAVAKKLGMSSLFKDDGTKIPVTVLRVEPNKVIGAVNNNVMLAIGKAGNNQKKPQAGLFAKHKVDAAFVREFRVSKEEHIPPKNTQLKASHFAVGQRVDVQATSKGKGFAGVMKRHNFSGLSASHGVSISHRSGGSTGQCQDPGRTFKGKKMAGRMGGVTVTTQNLEVVVADDNLLVLKGAVPGATNGYVRVQDAVKLPNQKIELTQPQDTSKDTSKDTAESKQEAPKQEAPTQEAKPEEPKQEAKPEEPKQEAKPADKAEPKAESKE